MNLLQSANDKNGRSTSQDILDQHSPTLSRTPRPYHLRGDSLSQTQPWNSIDDTHGTTPDVVLAKVKHSESSESGTEADDEKGPILRGLPAPAPRSHKGLRGTTPSALTPLATPLPTPPAFHDGEEPRFSDEVQKKGKKKKHTDQHMRDYAAYNARRRREVVRRVIETLLLCGIGVLVLNSQAGLNDLKDWLDEIASFLIIPPLVYLLYPLRRTVRALSHGKSLFQALRLGFHVPSRFDPGPLLYPVVLPFITALTLFHRNAAFLPAAIVCGISSIPPTITSRASVVAVPGNVQWLLSILPLHAAEHRLLWGSRGRPISIKVDSRVGVTTEDTIFIFPLHQALLSVLAFLTGSSLDPAELQLLSSALINIYFFARTPQTEILKAMIWLGGMCMLVACKDILAWEVALARIPTWKLLKWHQQQDLFSRIDQAVCTYLLTGKFRQHEDDSNSEEDVQPLKSISKLRPRLKLQLNGRSVSTTIPVQVPHSAIEPLLTKPLSANFAPPQRRSTISGVDAADLERKTRSKRAKPVLAGPNVSFLSFSVEQARARKYAYAALVYLLVVGIILGPVRIYVGKRALNANEPIGWALGYLFGELPTVRFFVVNNNLERWIILPVRIIEENGCTSSLDIELQRQHVFGAANTRLLICGYCLTVLGIGIAAVLRLTSVVEVDTRRKVFHGIMVAMLLPTIFVDPCFIALALGLILAIFLLLDLFRASQLPPISKPLTVFLAPYVDGRDHRGPVIVSHIFLLIGCAIPLWLSLAGAPRIGEGPWAGWDTSVRDVSSVSGVVCVGMGDAAASLIGRRYGRTKWYWAGGKSLEGSLAFAIAVTCGLFTSWVWLRIGGWVTTDEDVSVMPTLVKCFLAGSGASMIEATLTAGNDNVIVPIGLFLLVRGFKI